MATLIFTAITNRVVDNWIPAFELLSARGHQVRSLLFPHVSDPDSRGLADLPFDNIGSFPIETTLSQIDRAASRFMALAAAEVLRRADVNILVLTCCHAGPEAELMNALAARPSKRPILVGCQHGFAQNWDLYWRHFCVDYFITFGRYFLRNVPEPFKDRVIAAALPKLDRIRPVSERSFEDDDRPILFAAQTLYSPELSELLLQLQQISNRQVVIRPHPEGRSKFDPLRDHFQFLSPNEPIYNQMQRVSCVLTTGSTTVLEALAAQVPIVVLPEQRGRLYEEAGIVARMDAREVLQLASAQSKPHTRKRLQAFLEDASGSNGPDRAERAADSIERILASGASPTEVHAY